MQSNPMHIINEKNYQFYVPVGTTTPDYPLIEWCSQYLNRSTNFIDIGGLGFYSIVLSKYCKQVYAYHVDLSKTIELNKINNIIIDNELSLLRNVGFLKITNYKIQDYVTVLKENKYPPFIFDVQDHDYIKSMHYQIYPISGCPGMFLASDNPLFKTTKIEPLPYIKKLNLNCPMGLRVPNNPSIIETKEGYLCNIRASNYIYEPDFQFLEGNIHLSDHHMITFDKNFNIVKTVILQDMTQNTYYDSFVKGIDDLRLIDANTFICSHGNFNNHRTIDQCLGTFDEEGHITSLVPLKGPDPYRHEKNWLPLNNNGLYIIYMINPFTLYKIDTAISTEMIKVKEVNLIDLNLRGSAPCIPYKNGWLATAHEVHHLQYTHRFIWFDQNFETIQYSVPFYFEKQGIEFNLGMCHSPEGLLLAYSVRDNHSKLITVDYNIVDDYLNL